MRVALIPTEPDAAANDRWPLPAGRTLSLAHPPRPRVSDAANVRLGPVSSNRTVAANIRSTRS